MVTGSDSAGLHDHWVRRHWASMVLGYKVLGQVLTGSHDTGSHGRWVTGSGLRERNIISIVK